MHGQDLKRADRESARGEGSGVQAEEERSLGRLQDAGLWMGVVPTAMGKLRERDLG